ELLTLQGFRPIPVAEQMEPNGQFPNVTKTPNPEVPESMDGGVATAKANGADLVLSTDPDADRLGGYARERSGDYRFLTGNEIAGVLTHFKLAQLAKQGRLPASAFVIKTEGTTMLVTRVARKFGAQVGGNLLVGFKYIPQVLWQLEQTGSYEEVRATPQDFVIGGEESHGILVTPQIRDKDAAGAALLMAEMALDSKRQGRTVPEYLEALAKEFGYFRNEVLNLVM